MLGKMWVCCHVKMWYVYCDYAVVISSVIFHMVLGMACQLITLKISDCIDILAAAARKRDNYQYGILPPNFLKF